MLSPILTLALSTLIILLYGAFTNSARGSAYLTGLALFAAAAQLILAPVSGAAFATAHGVLLQFSPFTNLASLYILLAALVVLPLFHHMQPEPYAKPESSLLLLLSVTGMLIMVASADFLTFYTGLELMSFPLYILCAFHRHSAKSSEAGLKYFVLGGLASGLTLFGIALLFAATGETSFHAINHALTSTPQTLSTANPILIVALILTLLGTFFKLSAVPFHMWTPDVYEGAPTPVSAVMASLPKIAMFVVLVRLTMGPFAGMAATWQPTLAILATLSMFVGASLAIVQSNLKRLLAYSAIAHVGFMMVGAAATTTEGAGGVLFYVFVYAITMVALFATLIVTQISSVEDMKGLATKDPILAFLLLAMFFSLAGIPPLAGFMVKFAVFLAAVNAGYTWLAVLAVLASVIACFYPLWLIKIMYFEAPNPKQTLPAMPAPLQTLIIAVGLAIIGLGIFPTLIAAPAARAAQILF